MLIKDWMTKDVISVTPDTSMLKASKLLKEKGIRRLPVIDASGKLVGIVTDRDIKEASPSKATTLDVHELYYLLSEIKVKDIMTPNPVTINADDTVEKAAILMLKQKIDGMPVVDDNANVVGIITDTDIFNVLIDITGVYVGGVQMGFSLENKPGTLKEVLSVLKQHNARIVSILSSYDKPEPGKRQIYIRIHDMEKAEENKLKAELEQRFGLLYWMRDHVV
ncbi:MAG: CBS and ACT domain-containing protein [Desulfonauticus sp.]|nr:CBS and ACT domain-containing protein [Desulfonauticus sp.]